MSAVRFVSILAQRHHCAAYWCAVALEALVPRTGRSWRATCCICVDSLEVAGVIDGDRDAHRMNADTGHDMEHCAFCGSSGRDTLVASIPDAVFASPPTTFLESRCAYADRGGWLSTLPLRHPTAT